MIRHAASAALLACLSVTALAQTRGVVVPVEFGASAQGAGANASSVRVAGAPGAPGAPVASPTLAPILGVRPTAVLFAPRGTRLTLGVTLPVSEGRRSARETAIAADGRQAGAAGLETPSVASDGVALGLPRAVLPSVRAEDAERRPRDSDGLLKTLALDPGSAHVRFDGAGRLVALPNTLPEGAFSAGGRARVTATAASERETQVPNRDVPVPPTQPPSKPAGWLDRLGDHPVVVAFLWNFLTVGAAYIINPVRGAFLLTKFEPTVMPFVYMGSAAATALAVWAYGRFARSGRAKLVGGAIITLSASLAGWWAIGPALAATPALAFGFYMFGDVFSILSVTVFWSYMNDVFRGEGAKRYFGRLASAGSLGAIVMSLMVNLNVKGTGAIPLILVAAALYALTFGLMLYMERWARRQETAPTAAAAAAAAATKAPAGGMWKALTATKIGLLLAALVLLERLVPDFANYVFAFEMKAAYPVLEDFVRAQASFAAWQNGISFVAGLALAGWLLRKAGLSFGLATAAIANLIGMAAYVIAPGLGSALALNGVEGGIRYTFFKAAKEQTWSNVPKDVLFQLKAFIEAFVYRFGRGISGAILLGLTGASLLGLGTVPVALVSLPLAAAWIWVAWSLGKKIATP